MDRALSHLLPGNDTRTLTADEAAEIEDVLDAAEAWANGDLPWQQAASIGTLAPHRRALPQYTRFVALLRGPRDHRRPHLIRLIDQITLQSGYTATSQGLYDSASMHEHDDAIRRFRAA